MSYGQKAYLINWKILAIQNIYNKIIGEAHKNTINTFIKDLIAIDKKIIKKTIFQDLEDFIDDVYIYKYLKS